jgi:hypothetical protein
MSAKNSEAGTERPTHDAPRVPDHDLIRPIGQGSYGKVWLARNALGSFRAVKVVYRDQFDEPRPFQREYEGLKLFEPVSRAHEGLVDILQLGRQEAAGSFYYVMEAADDVSTGQQIDPSTYRPRTLEQEIRRRQRLPVRECLEIASALADALDYLHTSKLVHRDVKPSNIIFVGGVPKLADIGLVAEAGAGRSFVGTEGFVPPEGPGRPQSDLYSLGKVIYEMSMGKDRMAFPSPPTQLADLPERRQLQELNDIVTRACEPEPRRRYQSARELRGELELLRRGVKPSGERRKRKLARMAKTAAVVGVLLTALLAGLHFLRPTVLREVRRLTRPEVMDWRGAKLGDFDGDGEADVFVAARDQVFVMSAQGQLLTEWRMPNFSGDQFGLGAPADVSGDHKDEILLSWRDSSTNLNVGVYNQNLYELKRFRATGSLTETPQGLVGDSGLVAIAMVDLRQDGRRQLLAALSTNRARKPRGLCCFDFETQELLWTHPTAPFVKNSVLVDLNRDGLLDIVFGSQAVSNGNELDDGTDDSHSYLYAVSGNGTLLWRRETGGIYSTCTPLIADSNAEGTGRIFASVQVSPEFSKEAAAMLKYDLDGSLLARYDPGAPLLPGARTHLAGDAMLQILATDRAGRLHVLNSSLETNCIVELVSQQYHGTNDWVDLVLDAMTDLNGDGQQELVFHSAQVQTHSQPNPGRPQDDTTFRSYHDNQVLVLDSKLKPLARYTVADLSKRGPISAVLPMNLGPRGRRGLLVLGQEAILLELVRAWGK